jgi:hypothetical protein
MEIGGEVTPERDEPPSPDVELKKHHETQPHANAELHGLISKKRGRVREVVICGGPVFGMARKTWCISPVGTFPYVPK